jgi:hypothetical protein
MQIVYRAPVIVARIDTTDYLTVFLWFAAAGLLTLAGFYAVAAVRKWALRRDAVATFTLQDLRDMRTRGEISDREFATLRAQLLAQVDATPERRADDAGDVHAAGDDRP